VNSCWRYLYILLPVVSFTDAFSLENKWEISSLVLGSDHNLAQLLEEAAQKYSLSLEIESKCTQSSKHLNDIF